MRRALHLLFLLCAALPDFTKADNGISSHEIWAALGMALAVFLCLAICFSCCKAFLLQRMIQRQAAARVARSARPRAANEPYIVVAMITRETTQTRAATSRSPQRPRPPPPGLPLDLLPPPTYSEAVASAPPSVFPDDPPPMYSSPTVPASIPGRV